MTLTMEVLVAVVWVREYALLSAFDVRYNQQDEVDVRNVRGASSRSLFQ